MILPLLLLLTLAGCRSKAPETPEGLALDGRTLSWSAVEKADSYVVRIGSDEYDAATNAFTLPDGLFGVVSIAVQAVNDSGTSDWSATIFATAVIVLECPANVTQDGSVVSWDAVPYATGYVVRLDGVEYAVAATSYVWDATEAVDFQVLATGRSDGFVVSSDWSEVLRLKTILAAPANIRIADGLLVWDAVAGAAGYRIAIGDDVYETSVASLDVRWSYSGEKTVAVTALSASSDYEDSDATSADIVFPHLTLATPADVELATGVLTFSAVSGAEAYEIRVDGVAYATVTTTSYAVPAAVLESTGSYLEVVALSSVHEDSSASLKVYVSAILVSTAAELGAVTGGYVILANDILLTGSWTPIDFTGLFDGAGYTISGLLIQTDDANVGFFGTLADAVVRDLTIVGTIDVTLTTSGSAVGGLAGRAERVEVDNVTVDVDIACVSENGIGAAGGVFGILADANVADIAFLGTVTTSWMTTGGFAGRLEASSAPATVERVGILATIVSEGGEETPTGGFAGMALDNELTIAECAVVADVSGYGDLGGFVGYLGYGTIEDSYVRGTVHAGPMSEALLVVAGGFVGRVVGYNVAIVRCLAFTTLVWENESPDVRVGGFAGVTPGGSYANIYRLCGYADTTLDRIGDPDVGRGDGIDAIGTTLLEAIAAETGAWDFDGAEIRLAWE
jgi:hypothetical protein